MRRLSIENEQDVESRLTRIEFAILKMAEEIRMLRVPIEPLLSITEVARKLDVSERTVRRYIERGWLAVVNLPTDGAGRTVRVRTEDLREFIESHLSGHKKKSTTKEHSRSVSVPRLV